MVDLKKGDTVVVLEPSEEEKASPPYWVSSRMDGLVGTKQKISKINLVGRVYIEGVPGLLFSKTWLKKAAYTKKEFLKNCNEVE